MPTKSQDWYNYCLVQGDRERIRAYQNNLDPITKETLRPRASLDHRHSDGLVRGLLNWDTNKFLYTFERADKGQFGVLSEYLRNPPAVKAIGVRYGQVGRYKKKAKNRRYGPNGSVAPFHDRKILTSANTSATIKAEQNRHRACMVKTIKTEKNKWQ